MSLSTIPSQAATRTDLAPTFKVRFFNAEFWGDTDEFGLHTDRIFTSRTTAELESNRVIERTRKSYLQGYMADDYSAMDVQIIEFKNEVEFQCHSLSQSIALSQLQRKSFGISVRPQNARAS
jgi:hypothetical protein